MAEDFLNVCHVNCFPMKFWYLQRASHLDLNKSVIITLTMEIVAKSKDSG